MEKVILIRRARKLIPPFQGKYVYIHCDVHKQQEAGNLKKTLVHDECKNMSKFSAKAKNQGAEGVAAEKQNIGNYRNMPTDNQVETKNKTSMKSQSQGKEEVAAGKQDSGNFTNMPMHNQVETINKFAVKPKIKRNEKVEAKQEKVKGFKNIPIYDKGQPNKSEVKSQYQEEQEVTVETQEIKSHKNILVHDEGKTKNEFFAKSQYQGNKEVDKVSVDKENAENYKNVPVNKQDEKTNVCSAKSQYQKTDTVAAEKQESRNLKNYNQGEIMKKFVINSLYQWNQIVEVDIPVSCCNPPEIAVGPQGHCYFNNCYTQFRQNPSLTRPQSENQAYIESVLRQRHPWYSGQNVEYQTPWLFSNYYSGFCPNISTPNYVQPHFSQIQQANFISKPYFNDLSKQNKIDLTVYNRTKTQNNNDLITDRTQSSKPYIAPISTNSKAQEHFEHKTQYRTINTAQDTAQDSKKNEKDYPYPYPANTVAHKSNHVTEKVTPVKKVLYEGIVPESSRLKKLDDNSTTRIPKESILKSYSTDMPKSHCETKFNTHNIKHNLLPSDKSSNNMESAAPTNTKQNAKSYVVPSDKIDNFKPYLGKVNMINDSNENPVSHDKKKYPEKCLEVTANTQTAKESDNEIKSSRNIVNQVKYKKYRIQDNSKFDDNNIQCRNQSPTSSKRNMNLTLQDLAYKNAAQTFQQHKYKINNLSALKKNSQVNNTYFTTKDKEQSHDQRELYAQCLVLYQECLAQILKSQEEQQRYWKLLSYGLKDKHMSPLELDSNLWNKTNAELRRSWQQKQKMDQEKNIPFIKMVVMSAFGFTSLLILSVLAGKSVGKLIRNNQMAVADKVAVADQVSVAETVTLADQVTVADQVPVADHKLPKPADEVTKTPPSSPTSPSFQDSVEQQDWARQVFPVK